VLEAELQNHSYPAQHRSLGWHGITSGVHELPRAGTMQPESAPFAVSIAGPPSALASGVLASGPDPLEAPEEPPQAMKAPARVAIADAKFRRPHMAQAGEATREPVERAPVLLGKKRGYRRVGATRISWAHGATIRARHALAHPMSTTAPSSIGRHEARQMNSRLRSRVAGLRAVGTLCIWLFAPDAARDGCPCPDDPWLDQNSPGN
jgi:hypothetical protein